MKKQKPEQMIQSLTTGLQNGLNFSGRLARGPFWKFAPAWAALCAFALVALRFVFPQNSAGLPILFATTVLAIPFWSAVWRRYHDVGKPGIAGLYPLAPIISTAGCAYLIFTSEAATTFGSKDPVAVLLMASLIACAPAFFLRLFAMQGFGERLGEMLVSSEPGSNRYGPNPNEVSQ